MNRHRPPPPPHQTAAVRSDAGSTIDGMRALEAARSLAYRPSPSKPTRPLRRRGNPPARRGARSTDDQGAWEAARELAIRSPSSVSTPPLGDRVIARPGSCSPNFRLAGAAPLSAAAPEFVPASRRRDVFWSRLPSRRPVQTSTRETGSSISSDSVNTDSRTQPWTTSYPASSGEGRASPSADHRRGSTQPGKASSAAEISSLPAELGSLYDDQAPKVRYENLYSGLEPCRTASSKPPCPFRPEELT